MSALSENSPVGQWVAEQPGLARLFEELQIDYCCHGDRSLAEACQDQGLDVEQVVARFEEPDRNLPDESSVDWTSAPLGDLCDHIEATHHSYLKSELPRLTGLIGKVLDAHGESHPEIRQVQKVFAGLRAELEPHMMKEERILFPAIRQLEQSEAMPSFPFGSVANPIRMMEHEHDIAGNALKEIRRLTADFAVPNDACLTYQGLLDGCRQLEADLHQHIHKENNILFPRSIAREADRR